MSEDMDDVAVNSTVDTGMSRDAFSPPVAVIESKEILSIATKLSAE